MWKSRHDIISAAVDLLSDFQLPEGDKIAVHLRYPYIPYISGNKPQNILKSNLTKIQERGRQICLEYGIFGC